MGAGGEGAGEEKAPAIEPPAPEESDAPVPAAVGRAVTQTGRSALPGEALAAAHPVKAAAASAKPATSVILSCPVPMNWPPDRPTSTWETMARPRAPRPGLANAWH